MKSTHDIDVILAALADPTRRGILARLAKGEATVNELAEPYPISQPAVSRHIKVLLTAGLIEQRIDGTRRPCRLVPGALDELDRYLDMLRTAFEANYSRLDALLARQNSTFPAEPEAKPGKKHKGPKNKKLKQSKHRKET